MAGPRGDGRFYLAQSGLGLSLFRPGEGLTPFADGPKGYVAAAGEPYIALAPGGSVRGADCRFRGGEVFALEPDAKSRVIRIDRRGRAKPFASLPEGKFPSGITFDQVGRFDGRLLVTMRSGVTIDLLGIDCRGRVSKLVEGAPQVEGGIAVAPRTFEDYRGRLIAVDEFSGLVYALSAAGGVSVIAESGLPVGTDVGVEAVGFVPRGFGVGDAAYLADIGVAGTDGVLVADGAALLNAGIAQGDLLVATEAGAETIAVRCGSIGDCSVQVVASGPDVTHAEGHIVFGPAP